MERAPWRNATILRLWEKIFSLKFGWTRGSAELSLRVPLRDSGRRISTMTVAQVFSGSVGVCHFECIRGHWLEAIFVSRIL